MALTLGVNCKACGRPMEVDEPYIAGIRTEEIVAHYRTFRKAAVDFTGRSWEKTLLCAACGESHPYGADDLVLYDAQP